MALFSPSVTLVTMSQRPIFLSFAVMSWWTATMTIRGNRIQPAQRRLLSSGRRGAKSEPWYSPLPRECVTPVDQVGLVTGE